jgi:hypothetical protein
MMVFRFVLCGDTRVMAVEEKIGVGQGCSLRLHRFCIYYLAIPVMLLESETSMSLSYGRCHFLVDCLLGALAIHGL